MGVQWGTVRVQWGYSEDTVGIQSVTLLILGSDIFKANKICLASLSQDDLSTFVTLLPLFHDPGSYPFSSRILNDMTCRYPLYIEERHPGLGRDATFPWSRALTHHPR